MEIDDDDIHEFTCIGCGCCDSLACPGGCDWLITDERTMTGVCTRCPKLLKAFKLDPSVRVKRAPIVRHGGARGGGKTIALGGKRR